MDRQRIPRQALHWEVQEGSRSSACKLEEQCQQGLVNDGNHLG